MKNRWLVRNEIKSFPPSGTINPIINFNIEQLVLWGYHGINRGKVPTINEVFDETQTRDNHNLS